MTRYYLLALVLSLALIIAVGTVFFRLVEGWSWIDAYFFSVVTLSTVGYGQLVPATVLGKIGTTVFIFLGLGIFALVIQQIGHFTLRSRQDWLVAHLGQPGEEDEAPPPANLDQGPRD